MADPLCEPFEPCAELDVNLVLSTVVHGPPIASDPSDVAFGPFTAGGAALRPYVEVALDQVWVAKEACYGPVCSVFSLAPGETLAVVTTTSHQIDIVQALTAAARPEPWLRPAIPIAGVVSGHDTRVEVPPAHQTVAAQNTSKSGTVQMQSRYLGGYGSLLESVFDPLGVVDTTVGAAQGVADGVADLASHAVGGSAPAVKGAMDQAAHAVDDVARGQAREAAGQTSRTTTDTTMSSESVTRTFANPYRDRSMQLRFMPVFRHFEVTTSPRSVTPGVAAQAGRPRGAPVSSGRQISVPVHLATAAATADPAAIQAPVLHLLSGQVAAGRAGGAATSPALGLLWSRTTVRDDAVLVPLAEPATAASAFGLSGGAAKKFGSALQKLDPETLTKVAKALTQDVHLYLGTHVEAVAGTCVLPDVPALQPEP